MRISIQVHTQHMLRSYKIKTYIKEMKINKLLRSIWEHGKDNLSQDPTLPSSSEYFVHCKLLSCHKSDIYPIKNIKYSFDKALFNSRLFLGFITKRALNNFSANGFSHLTVNMLNCRKGTVIFYSQFQKSVFLLESRVSSNLTVRYIFETVKVFNILKDRF